MAALLRRWADAEDEPDKLILPLEHAYTPAEAVIWFVEGEPTPALASVLVKAAAEWG